MVSPLGTDRSSTTHHSSAMPVLISHFSHRRKKQGGLAKSSSRLIHALKEKPKSPGVQLDLVFDFTKLPPASRGRYEEQPAKVLGGKSDSHHEGT